MVAAESTEPSLPQKTALSLLLFGGFLLVWTLYATISAATISIHTDMAEAYVWGQTFSFGHLHPPFWSWVAGIWFSIFPRSDWAFYLLSTCNAGLGLVGSWFLLGNFARGDRRLAATWLLLLTPFYTFLALKFNANSIFLSLWPWTLNFFVRSIDGRRLSDALLFGIFMGLAILSKYFALILAATCFVAALIHSDRRAYFRSFSPYISFAATLLVLAPHLVWLVRSGAPSFRYFANKTGYTLEEAVLGCIALITGLLAFHALVLILIGISRKRVWPLRFATGFLESWKDPKFRILLVLAVLPVALTVLSGLVFRLKVSTNMAIGICSLVPLLLMELYGPGDDRRLYVLARNVAIGIAVCALLLSPLIALATLWSGRDNENMNPKKELAAAVTRLWHQQTGLPLRYVGGSRKTAYAVAFYSADQPRGLGESIDGVFGINDAASQTGFVLVCMADEEGNWGWDDRCIESAGAVPNPNKHTERLTLAHSSWGLTGPPFPFLVTLVPPVQ
jgi:4-amino-4-deoxy-L-arabinose transferase-like glycosyltransferase